MKALRSRFLLTALLATLAAVASCRSPEPGEMDEDGEPMSATSCGSERWSVKTATDADVGQVNQSIEDTTIGTLTAFPVPSNLPSDGRVAPYETQVYRLKDVMLTYFASESDSDYHLAVKDPATGAHMIVESSAPGCLGGTSPLLQGITAARNDVHVGTSTGVVTVIGVGFFDYAHGQNGVAPNAFELHPILGICYGTGCTIVGPTPTPSGTPLPTSTPTPGSSGTPTPSPTGTRGGNGALPASGGCSCEISGAAPIFPGAALVLLVGSLAVFRRRRPNHASAGVRA